jgi:hypothetical protein
MILARKMEVLGENPLLVTLCLSDTPEGLRWHIFLSIQGVLGGKVSILGGHSIGHSKQNKCICTRVLFRTVSERELINSTDAKWLIRKRYYVLFLTPVFVVQVTKLIQIT